MSQAAVSVSEGESLASARPFKPRRASLYVLLLTYAAWIAFLAWVYHSQVTAAPPVPLQ
jgi:hypothetical protein